jgi:density-regulated protein DRP1
VRPKLIAGVDDHDQADTTEQEQVRDVDTRAGSLRCVIRLTARFEQRLTADWVTVGVDLKKAAKLFATKFACGSSVTKNLQGLDEIVVQGDVSGDIVEMIEDQVGVLKGVPAENVVEVEEKKKKGEN